MSSRQGLAAEKRAGLGIGYVPQGRQIFPLRTVEEDLQIGLPVILVEQKPPFTRKVANRFLVLNRGRLVARGDMTELSDNLVKEYRTV